MVNEAWEELKDRYVKLAREEGLSEGMELGRRDGFSDGVLKGIEKGRSEGIKSERDEILAALGMSAEALEQKKREYRLKNNLA